MDSSKPIAMGDSIVTSCHLEKAEFRLMVDEPVSPDKVAWADSCLIKDPEMPSEPNLDSLKEALLEFVSYHSEQLETSAAEGSSSELSLSSEVGETSNNFEIDVDEDEVSITEATENNNGGQLIEEKPGTPLSRSYLEKAFLPTYKDEVREIQYSSDSEVDFPEFAIESSSEDIFQVWDLCLPVEEDVLMKQLNKAIADSSLKKVLSTFDGSASDQGFEDDSIDDLVTGIAVLSLKKSSG